MTFSRCDTEQQFPLRGIAEQIKTELAGCGFILLRGLPVWEMSDAEAACAYWAIGKLLGEGVQPKTGWRPCLPGDQFRG
jgi:hypothetical protein